MTASATPEAPGAPQAPRSEGPRVALFVKLFGRGGARVAYSLIGLTLIALGAAMLLFPGEAPSAS